MNLSSWPSYPIVIVTSSTGNGEPPSNAETFWRMLKRKSDDNALSHVSFALLGLGDSNYDSFMGFPQDLCTKLHSLGAKLIGDFGKADEATDLECTVEPWIDDLYELIPSFFSDKKKDEVTQSSEENSKTSEKVVENSPSSSKETSEKAKAAPTKKKIKIVSSKGSKKTKSIIPTSINKVSTIEFIEPENHIASTLQKKLDLNNQNFDRERPYLAKILSAKRLTSSDAVKQVIELIIDTADTNFNIRPGDAIGILPENDEELVEKIMERLDIKNMADRYFVFKPLNESLTSINPHIQTPCTLRDTLLKYVSLTSLPSKRFLMTLSEYCTDQADKENMSKLATDKDEYAHKIEQTRATLLDLLNQFPSCKPDISHLLDILPPLTHRFFSVANSFKKSPNIIRIIFVVVNFPLPPPNENIIFKGVCTNWMFKISRSLGYLEGSKMQESYSIPIFPRASSNFVLSEDPSQPIIMIGPGTGIAPFLGFLEEREYLMEVEKQNLGPALLFTGCRHPEKDWLYKDVLKNYEEKKVLTKLIPAFSRYEPNKVDYVTHKLREYKEEVYDLMKNKNAKFYICGDALSMAKDVKSIMIEIIKSKENKTEEEAKLEIDEWIKEKRYLLDIWT